MKKDISNKILSKNGRALKENLCFSCGIRDGFIIYELPSTPVNSVVQISSREEAVNFPTGDITLWFCKGCGFISNVTYDPFLTSYNDTYESTQIFSKTFSSFNRNLALQMIERYDLKDKDIIEIGCGNGEFLTLLCDLGQNRGVGFDPAFNEGRCQHSDTLQIRFVKDFFSERYSDYAGDFLICKMTLEHIQNTADFLKTISRSLKKSNETIVFFQVPNGKLILKELAFWDIYYEHCSYFSAGSLARLFRECGYEIVDLWSDYDDQYLMIAGKPGGGRDKQPHILEETPQEIRQIVESFSKDIGDRLSYWREYFRDAKKNRNKVVIWGGGSKGVAFLTTLKIGDEVKYAVDINPHKQDMYMAGTGQRIVSPEFLKEYRPDAVILMNPVYLGEVRDNITQMGLHPKIVTV